MSFDANHAEVLEALHPGNLEEAVPEDWNPATIITQTHPFFIVCEHFGLHPLLSGPVEA